MKQELEEARNWLRGRPTDNINYLCTRLAKAVVELSEIPVPIRMRLVCEGCGVLHVDEGEFATKPHHTHQCAECGLVWRPAEQCTVGVKFLWPQSGES